MDSLASDDLLIEEGRRRPLLYDQHLKTYRDKQLQRDAWEQVSTVLGQSVPDIEHRWHSLRQKFLRLRKAYVKSRSGSDAVKKKWALFDNLMFLNDAIQSRILCLVWKEDPVICHRKYDLQMRLPQAVTQARRQRHFFSQCIWTAAKIPIELATIHLAKLHTS
ncbi:transcription factor Adf-1-like [Rhipicephalus microplus]|uniref:transcription factor Adf-1-like n=1 Tax=Rhipicephalus microplus TaxID=6941 RepID=UPI003F6A7C60